MVSVAVEQYGINERRACRIVGQPRSSQRYAAKRLPDEDEITEQIVVLASEYGRYGYRMITATLRQKGYCINHKRVYRIWRELGLEVPKKQPKRRRLWLNDGSCVRLGAEHKNHVWSYDFVETKTSKGRKIKILNIIDEYTRECLTSHAAFRIRSEDVKDILREIMLKRGTPEYIRSDNGSRVHRKTPVGVAERNGDCTNVHHTGLALGEWLLREFQQPDGGRTLNREIFDTIHEAKVFLGRWVRNYNTIRPHSALGYRPPAPEAALWSA